MPRVITIASQKGGVGKTTTTVNLASSLVLAGRRVLLMDLDPQGNATSGVGAREGDSDVCYLSALLDGRPLKPFLRSAESEGLSVLPSSPEMGDLDIVQRLIACPPRQLRQSIDDAAKEFDFVLIDCPPSLTGPPTIALHICDSVIIPIQCEYYAMEGLSQILPVVQNVQESKNPTLKIEGLLLTMFSPDLELSQEVVDEIRGYFQDSAFNTIVPRDVILAEAASHGRPAMDYAPDSRGAWSYVELAREVLEHGETQTR